MREEITKIQEVIQEFQEGYLRRDLDAVEKFMDLFCDEDILEIIGTDAYIKGQGEWCLDKNALKKMISGDQFLKIFLGGIFNKRHRKRNVCRDWGRVSSCAPG